MNLKNCPACATPMREIKTISTYDSPVFINQCESCGGLWFDDLEIYRIKIGEANNIEGVDKEKLRIKTNFQNENLKCPNDNSVLNKFQDPSFPASLQINNCPACSGLWLNHGEFVEFQKQREEVVEKNSATEQPKVSGEDKEFDEQIQKMLAAHSITSDSSSNFANFLSTPIDPMTNRPMFDSDGAKKANLAIDVAFGVLKIIFSLFMKN